MTTAAAKGRSSWRLIAAGLAVLVAAGAAEANRFTPSAAIDLLEKQGNSSIAAAQHADDLAATFVSRPSTRFPLFTAADRDALTAPLAGDLASALDPAAGEKLASGLETWEPQVNIRRIQHLASDSQWWPVAYARARWYDARNASWLSEDPAGSIDSPNLYSFVAWQPHMYTDPMGECLGLDEVPCTVYADEIIDQFHNPRNFLSNAARSARFALFEMKGAALAVPRAAKGVYDVATHPFQTVTGAYEFGRSVVADFPGSAQRFGNALMNADPDRAGEFVGETLFFAGLGGVAKTTEGAAALQRLGRGAGLGSEAAETITSAAGSAETRARILANIAESRGARGVSRFGEYAFREQAPSLLQGFANTIVNRAAADPMWARTFLRPRELAATLRNQSRLTAPSFGKVVERALADYVSSSEELSGLFRHIAGPNRPDFAGVGRLAGLRFELTTTTSRSFALHLARPYGRSVGYVLYSRPQGFHF
jgi:RHS repeat-associated protein